MRRRRLLASAVATSAATAVTALSGCLGGDDDVNWGDGDGDAGDQSGSIAVSQDGYAPDDVPEPEPADADPSSFERIDVEGREVPLAPIDVTHAWYGHQEARFADARGEGQYLNARIRGAAWSPARDGREGEDPVDEWPTDDRIVCYCGCPHHLSSLRAAALLEDGYEDVYVIDEGFHEWASREYPMAGSDVGTEVAERVITGRADAAHAGEPVYATHAPSDQREAAFVGTDGGFELVLRFAGVTDDSEIRLDAPGFTVVARLAELTSGPVTAP